MNFSPEEEALLKKVEQELNLDQARSSNFSTPYNNAGMFGGQPKQNLVEWQLDFSAEMQDIGRLLRCDVLHVDEQGNETWIRNPRQDQIVFNDLGVNDIAREIRMVLNKNTVLSNYREEQIKERVRQLGHELRALIYNNSEKYGFDNDYKWNNYSIMVLTILGMVESAYRMAINGEERKDLNQARVVNQNEPMMPQNFNMYPMMQPQKKGGLSRVLPWNWNR